MKYIVFLATIALFAHQSPTTDPRFEQVGIENVRGTYGAYTPPALQPTVDSFYAWGEALYWKPSITSAGYASGHTGAADNYPYIVQPQFVSFNWDWGFRVGLGYHTLFDGWNIATEFTRFKFDASNSITASSGNTVIPTYVSADIVGTTPDVSFCTQSSSNYDIDYNTLSGTIGRDFFVSKRLSLSPSFGVKGEWIDHKQTVFNTGGTRSIGGLGDESVTAIIITNTSGVGPLISLNTGWYLSENWSFLGNFGYSLIISKLHASLKETYSGDPTTQMSQGSVTTHRIVPNPALAIGLEYGTYFSNNTMRFNARIGFETQYYINQRIILSGGQLVDYYYSDLSLYGFNFSVGLDF